MDIYIHPMIMVILGQIDLQKPMGFNPYQYLRLDNTKLQFNLLEQLRIHSEIFIIQIITEVTGLTVKQK